MPHASVFKQNCLNSNGKIQIFGTKEDPMHFWKITQNYPNIHMKNPNFHLIWRTHFIYFSIFQISTPFLCTWAMGMGAEDHKRGGGDNETSSNQWNLTRTEQIKEKFWHIRVGKIQIYDFPFFHVQKASAKRLAKNFLFQRDEQPILSIFVPTQKAKGSWLWILLLTEHI